MDEREGVTSPIGDLFGERPIRLARDPIALPTEPPELRAAKALAAQLRRKRSRRDKQEVAHLICLNLISMLKHGQRSARR